MAYAYPEIGTANPQLPPTRKGSDQDASLLREFKRKLYEDESIIGFFNERIKIEQQYIESMNKLYAKVRAQDALHDDVAHRGQTGTVRKAWVEVRDYTQREVQAREGLVHALKLDVVNRLNTIKETQSRIRLRIKEDLKSATDAYDDQAYNRLPKLKKAYMNKTQALEDHRRQENAVMMQAKLLAESSPQGSPSHEKPYPFSPPSITGPLPASSNPHISPAQTDAASIMQGNSGSGSGPGASTISFATTLPPPPERKVGSGNRNRAGSGSGLGGVVDLKSKEVLSDIAAQGKKSFSAIMQRLGGDKNEREDGGIFGGGTGGGSGTGSATASDDGLSLGGVSLQRRGSHNKSGGSAMKGVKAKREAEDADKAYRLGIFHLESLRLRRDKLQQSAMTSLQQFNDELNVALVQVLSSCMSSIHATDLTLAQATEVPKAAIKAVNLESDTMLFRSRLVPALLSAQRTAAPVLYDNYYVGPCKSLIFGISLTDYDFARGEGGDHGRPPAIVEKCVAWIDQKGLDIEGIYRISGRLVNVQKMIQDIELDEEKFEFPKGTDVHSACNVLKQYLRELPEPVFPLPHSERVKLTENRESHIQNNFSILRGRLRRLQPIHQTTFRAIIEHLARVQSHSAQNKMDAKNLAVVFNTVLFGPDQLPADGNVLALAQEKDTVLEDMISYSGLLFSTSPDQSGVGATGAQASPAAAEEELPGSSRTRFQIIHDPVEEGANQTDGESRAAPDSEESVEPIMPAPQFTPESALVLLFPSDRIPTSFKESVGGDLHVRPLASDDFLRSHFGLLSTLTTSPALAPSIYSALFKTMQSCSDTYFIVVLVDRTTDQIVAAGTLLVERKFIHAGGAAGHIEDIVVSPNMQGRGLGLKLVTGLREMASELGCYKTILDCKEEKTKFYEKCGFALRGRQMAYYDPLPDGTKPSVTPSVPPPSSAPLNPAALLAGLSQHLVASPINGDAANSITGGLAAHETMSEIGSTAYESASDASGVTYHFPVTVGADAAGSTTSTAADRAPLSLTTAGAVLSSSSPPTAEDKTGGAVVNLASPTSTESGLASATATVSAPVTGNGPTVVTPSPPSPLPPGAAPPAIGTNSDRLASK